MKISSGWHDLGMVDWEKHPQQEQEQAPPQYLPPPYPPPYPPAYGPAYYGYPPPVGMLPPQGKPSTNIGWAIGALLTFWPLAIPSFIAALKVDDLWFRGDAAGAHRASADARKFGIIGVCVGGAFVVLGFVFLIVFFVAFAGTVDHLN